MKNKKNIFVAAVVFFVSFFLAVATTEAAPCGSVAGSSCQQASICNSPAVGGKVDTSLTGCFNNEVCCVPSSATVTPPVQTMPGLPATPQPQTPTLPNYTNPAPSDYQTCLQNGGNADSCKGMNGDPSGSSSASTPAGGPQIITFANPIKASSMAELLGNVLNALLGVVAFISLIFIIIGAVMYMLSSGNEQMIERAKKTIAGAVVGLAIAAAAPTFLKEIKNILGGATGANPDDIVNNAYTIKDIAVNVLNFLLAVTGIIAIIGLIIGAIFYLTSYGDEDRMEKGKKIFWASIIGIVIAFAALVIVRQVASLIAANVQ